MSDPLLSARQLTKRFGGLAAVNDVSVDLQALSDRLLWLVEKVTQDRWFRPRVLPQLHVFLWGNKRGV